MLIASFRTSAWQANCYVLAAADGQPCVVIDPGIDAAPLVDQVVEESGLSVAGVVLTHGHLDHVADAAAVCERHDAPCWIHPADRHLLSDPGAGLSADFAALIAQATAERDFHEPADVRDLVHATTLSLAGLELRLQEAPGHTQGSTLIMIDYDDAAVGQVMFSGDVLFAGSIGRTDLPGGDPAQMERSLERIVADVDPATAVLPGHGPQTLLSRELATNPYLAR